MQQTIREKLPEGFQKAEYLLARGMVDMVEHRLHARDAGAFVPLITAEAPRIRGPV
jgi:acetyl-CoA carboxylase carboxyl transferase subunit beta